MNIRETLELEERERLSPKAALSINSKGRIRPETECNIRTCYQLDRDRILNSKAWRRMKGKTQVWVKARGDHYRTRLQHSLEVAQVSRTVARALRLNEDLTEAICLSHDLGHCPAGHPAEEALDEIFKAHGMRFEHNHQSLRVVDILENNGKGLNLTQETRDGILNHTGETVKPSTLEAQIVKFLDKVYIFHDLEDAERAGLMTINDIPADIQKVVGDTLAQQLHSVVSDMIYASRHLEVISFSPKMHKAFYSLRDLMYEKVYFGVKAKAQAEKVKMIITALVNYYLKHIEEVPEFLRLRLLEDGPLRVVADYISGMTDDFALVQFNRIFIPEVL